MVKQAEGQIATAIIEQRAEPRLRAGSSVLLKTSNAHPVEACLLDVSSRGARLRVPEAVSIGAAVTIEAPELLLSGTVKRCGQIHRAYEVGIALSFPLEVLGELRKLNAALLTES